MYKDVLRHELNRSVRHFYYTIEKQRISGILKSSHYKLDTSKGSNATEKEKKYTLDDSKLW